MANIPSISNRIYYSTEFKKTLTATFVCVAMTLGFLAITEPVFAANPKPPKPPPHPTPTPTATPRPSSTPTAAPSPSPTPTPVNCQVCERLHDGRYEQKTEPCADVQHFLAEHPGSCAGPCPCHITGVQNP